MQYSTISNKQIALGQELGSGGEAIVYELQSNPDSVAKIYHRAKCPPVEKLKLMMANPPKDPTRSLHHVSISWISDLVQDNTGCIVGYLMPKISHGIAIHKLYHPRTRRKNYIGFTWQYLHRTSYNLASAVAAIHEKNYVIGDLNESNILVQPNTMVTLIDTDSFQVMSPQGHVFRCPVGKPEYVAPEIQGVRLSTIDREEVHDRFALAVLIFLLLMEGSHPFRGDGEPSDLPQRIKHGLFPFSLSDPPPRKPPRLSVPFQALYSEVQQLFHDCFVEGYQQPSRRPKASDWVHALKRAEQALIPCPINKFHYYLSNQKECTWCERTRILQGYDPFPEKVQQQNVQSPLLPQKPLPPISPPPPPIQTPPISPNQPQPPQPTRFRILSWSGMISLWGGIFIILIVLTRFFNSDPVSKLNAKTASRLLQETVSPDWQLTDVKDFFYDEYAIECFKNRANYDSGDFNGDNLADIAILAKHSSNPHADKVVILWGTEFKNYDIIDYASPFEIVQPGKILGYDGELNLKNDGIEMLRCESSAWIDYWNGTKFERFFLSD